LDSFPFFFDLLAYTSLVSRILALERTTKSFLQLDGNLVQFIVVWSSTESLGGHAANAKFDARQRVQFHSLQTPSFG
jgi:hypothetical protein